MFNLPVIVTPLRTYLYGHTSFWMEVIFLQHLLIEYMEKYNFLKIANAKSIFADVKSIIQLSRLHFFANMKYFELERLERILLMLHAPHTLYSKLMLLTRQWCWLGFCSQIWNQNIAIIQKIDRDTNLQFQRRSNAVPCNSLQPHHEKNSH